jgi:mannose-6-phosphate isomerase
MPLIEAGGLLKILPCFFSINRSIVPRAISSRVLRRTLRMPDTTSDTSPKFDRRPWGTFTVLDEGENFKVKRIEVLPGKRLSYQKHSQRAEHWVVVQGTAKVTLDDRELLVHTGQAIDIAIGSAHRVENPNDQLLIFIEVQRGSYLGEDDIVRLQDDFGRTA